MNKLPGTVASLCYSFDAWLVGSAADPATVEPRDYDIAVPWHNWHPAAQLIPLDAYPNSFRGWKFLDPRSVDPVEIDVWPCDLGWLMQNDLFKWAYHPRTGTRIHKEAR